MKQAVLLMVAIFALLDVGRFGIGNTWWWGLNLSGQALPVIHPQATSVILAIGFVGALLHFAVIHRSFGFHGAGFLWPVLVSLVVSGAVFLLLQ